MYFQNKLDVFIQSEQTRKKIAKVNNQTKLILLIYIKECSTKIWTCSLNHFIHFWRKASQILKTNISLYPGPLYHFFFAPLAFVATFFRKIRFSLARFLPVAT